MDNVLQNQELWVGIDSRGMPFTSELELLQIVRNRVKQSSGCDLRGGDILSIQKVVTKNPVHIIYCNNTKTRDVILACLTVNVDNREYELVNFQSSISKGLGETSFRVSIHGLPFSVTDREIEAWVDSWACRSSQVRKANAKLNDNSQNILLNGNRYCYVDKVLDQMPRYSTYTTPDPIKPESLIDIHITVYYDGQPINCRKCLELGHDSRNCNPKYQNQTKNTKFEIFRGTKNPLSNFYPVQMQCDNKIFPSAEHLYQYKKATTMGLADESISILEAPSAHAAMLLGEEINRNHNTTEWDKTRCTVMRQILDLKYDSCEALRQTLCNTKDKVLVEATKNTYWGSGLPPRDTDSCHQESWPGRNKLGELLMDLRLAKSPMQLIQRNSPTNAQTAMDIDRQHTSIRTDAMQVAQDLITKALHPTPHQISSDELMAKADNIINSSVHTKGENLETGANTPITDDEITSPLLSRHMSKRKDISPVSGEDKQKTKKQATHTIDQFFTPSATM